MFSRRLFAAAIGILSSTVSSCSTDSTAARSASKDAASHALESSVSGASREEAWVSNSGETTISVIDSATRTVVDTIELGIAGEGGALQGIAHGIAVASAHDVAYAGTEDSGEVIAIDTRTRAVSWRLKAGSNFQLGTLTADDRYLFVPDLLAGRVVVIDTEKHVVDREIVMVDPMGEAGATLQGLHNMYTSFDGSSIFATAIFSQRVARIDPLTRQVQRVYAVDGQPRPAAFTGDLSTMYLQLSALHGFIAVDLATGQETARVTIPDDGSRPPGWDNWTLSHGIYLTRDEKELWVDSVVAGKVYVYSVPELEQLAALDVGIMPRWFAATEDETALYVSNTTPAADHGTVSVIDRTRRAVVATLDVGKAPKDVHMVRVR